MPIWVIGGTNSMLGTEGNVLKGVDMGDVRSSHGLENGGVPICTVRTELGKLVGRVGIAVQQ